MIQENTYQKILVIATHCIGDSLLITTLVRSLRKRYPDAQLDVLVNARGEMVFGPNPDVDSLVEIPQRPRIKHYLQILRQHGRYDLVVNEMLNDRTAIYSFVFGRQRLGVVDSTLKNAWLKRRIYHYHLIERNNHEHKMSRMARMLKLIGVDIVPRLMSPEETLPVTLQDKLPREYIVVHAPSSNEIKQWPIEYWRDVIKQLLEMGYHIVLSGAGIDRDRAIVESLLDGFPESKQLMSVVGELSLAQTSMLLKLSKGFVGPDSGPGHMASGYPIPIVSIISVAPASLWSPWPYMHNVDTANNLYQNRIPIKQIVGNIAVLQSERQCVPCYKNTCCISDDMYSPCLVDITPDRVVDMVREMIPLAGQR